MKLLWKSLALVLGAVVFFSGAAVVATWAPDQTVQALSVRWANAPSRFVPVGPLSVHLRDEGPRSPPGAEAPLPLVLLHGTSASLHTWDGWVAALGRERRVIRFDLPGFGLTGPDPAHDYRIDRYAQFVLATLDQLGVRRFALAGNSLGGQIAWTTALAAPDRVAALVLVDASGYPLELDRSSDNVPIGFRIAATPGLNRVMEWTLPRGLVESSVRNVYGDPTKVTPQLVDRYFELTLREGNRAALAHRLQQGYTGPVERLPEIRQPTLILWGGRDRLIPVAMAHRFARDIPGGRLVVFDDLGHVPHEEDPPRTAEAVRGFLAGR